MADGSTTLSPTAAYTGVYPWYIYNQNDKFFLTVPLAHQLQEKKRKMGFQYLMLGVNNKGDLKTKVR